MTAVKEESRGAEEIRDVIEGLRGFVDKRVLPLEERHATTLHDPTKVYDLTSGRYSDEVRKLMREVRMESAEAGFYTLQAPGSVGGGELGAVAMYELWKFLHSTYGSAMRLPYSSLAHWTSGPSFLGAEMSERLRYEVMPSIMSGETTVCFGMSEAGAGSDARSMSTTARRDGHEWVINGEKMWISNGPTADYAYIFAVTDAAARQQGRGGVSCFVVPCDTPGFAVESVIRLFGHVGGNEAIISLRDVRLPEDHLVGTLGSGFELAMRGVGAGRMYNAGRSVGLGQWAVAQAVAHASTRRAFGQEIAGYQGVSFQLAESAIELYAADAMSLKCAEEIDSGRDASVQMSMTKAFTTEVGFKTLDRAMQVHGAMGFTNELGMYDGWHETRVIRIADGSAEVMRRNIARALIKGHYKM